MNDTPVALFVMIMFTVVLDNSPLSVVGAPWLMATYSIAGSRLVLNLRSLTFDGGYGTTNFTTEMEWRATVPKTRNRTPRFTYGSETDVEDFDLELDDVTATTLNHYH